MRPDPHILLVKTSSLGDLVHNLPVVSDLLRRFPGALIDWVAEESFADIPALHPGVQNVHKVALRRWKKAPLARETRNEFAAFRRAIRGRRYDLVLDTQGLVKSAWLACQADGQRAGYDWNSAREPLASLSYHLRYPVDRRQHAVARNRQLAAAVFGCSLEEASFPLDYGLQQKPYAASWLPNRRYVVLLTATSRDDKLWDEASWIALGRHLAAHGFGLVLPGGSVIERARAERLASAINQSSHASAHLPPPLPIKALAGLLGGADAAVGVDTGLTHLAAAAGVPTVALYTATDPGLTGVLASTFHRNLGGKATPPALADVLAALADAGLPV
jgi:heptosyltransferase I